MDLVAAAADSNVTVSLFITGTGDEGRIEHGKLPNRTFARRISEADLVGAIDGYQKSIYGAEHDRQRTLCYVCGPPKMTDEYVGFLRHQPGMAEDRSLAIHINHQNISLRIIINNIKTSGMAEQHVYRLSSIDQSLLRTYIRYCLCFPCEDADISEVTNKLLTAVKRTVANIPILAGTVQSMSGSGQSGRLEVSITLEQVDSFVPAFKDHHSDPRVPTYEELSAAAMPAMDLIGTDFTPLPDTPDSEGSPAFAVQASFIRGGLIVALYLHHSVADIHGLAQIMQQMSSGMPLRTLSDSDLRHDALEQSRLRDRLLGSRGVRAEPAAHPEYSQTFTDGTTDASHVQGHRGCSRVLGFNLKLVEGMKDLINERFHNHWYDGREVHISGFNCMAAILWKAVNRASWPRGAPHESQMSTLMIPVKIRNRVEPPLDDGFFGNAGVHASTYSAIIRLSMPLELTSVQHAASLIRMATANVNEHYVRTAIAAINKREDVIENNIPSHRFDTSLVVTSWADLPLNEAHLSLGMGKPEWGRKLGRSHSAFGCIVLPVKRAEGVWEVTVQVTEDVMERMVEDQGLMKYVKWVS
ncbi:hypothetical protein LTR36_002931 [Oleoguttula mirabilis]|uniref:Transferase family-domain-containing protein n=1 Tax=Oleoguttula mirabilis TaxID=1507867 RepID=A0AAV9JKS0_9PEZI|nr:hypothetical protein LTR36_002931 [Oleoguttula mirabilis]